MHNGMNIPSDGPQDLNVPECTACDEGNPATMYCEADREYLCEECTKAHKRMRATSKHTLVAANVQMDLAKDFSLNESESGGKTVSSGYKSICTMCDDKSPAVSYCGACKKFMCEECTTAHKRMKMFTNHDVVAVKESNVSATGKDTSVTGKATSVKQGNRSCFCLSCDRLTDRCLDGHKVVSISDAYDTRRRELKEMAAELKLETNEIQLEEIQKAIQQEDDNYAYITNSIQEKFQGYLDIIQERKRQMSSSLNETHEQNQKILTQNFEDIQNHMTEVNETTKTVESLFTNTVKDSFLAAHISLRNKISKLRGFRVSPHDTQILCLDETLPLDEFQRLMEGGKSFRTDVSGNYVVHADPSSSYNGLNVPLVAAARDDNTTIEYQSAEHMIGTIKSVSLGSGQLYCPSGSGLSDRFRSNLESNPSQSLPYAAITYRRPNSNENPEQQFKVHLTEKNVPKGKLEILNAPGTQTLIEARLRTHKLCCHWKVEGEEIKVFANTDDVAEFCKDLVNGYVSVEEIHVRSEAMILVESDKWLEFTNWQKQKYPDQVSIEVLHDEKTIAVYGQSANVSRDVCDAVNIFFRENNLKIMYLKYDQPVVTRLMKHRKLLKKTLTSWSQYCVDVTQYNDVTILVKGIGVGLAQVARSVHELAGKCQTTFDDDANRHDGSGDDNDLFDDENRFDELPVRKLEVELELKDISAQLRSISLIGDDRVVFVCRGDITELPAEVIVNPADKNLRHNGGLAKQLVRKGGRCIQDECTAFKNKHRELQVGEVMCSGAGTLYSHLIIHAVGPKWIDGCSHEETLLETAVQNCLGEANKRMYAAVAIPSIGAGAFEFPPSIATRCIVRAIQGFFLKKPASGIREIYLVDVVMDNVTKFTEALEELYTDVDHIESTIPVNTPALIL